MDDSERRSADTVRAGKPRSELADTLPTTTDDPLPPPPVVVSAFDAGADRFVEIGELGRGGMGRVAEVTDGALGRTVAKKQMTSRHADAHARFEREVRITARLEHPGIVPIYEAGRDRDGAPYYVMRRLDGAPLEIAVQKCAGLAERLALVPNVLAACDAIAFAHARRILHRDLKPQNILVGGFGETLVIDWGLACEIGEPDGLVVGTPGFMAPEQSRGDVVDPRTDVFALGATLFFVIAGEPAYAAASGTELVARVAADQAPDWRRLPARVPDDLRAILERALARDPRARYPDAGALAADLRRFVSGNLVAAYRYGRIERLWRFVRRHRAAVAVGAIAVVAVVAIAALAFSRVRAERDAAELARRAEADRAGDLAIARARAEVELDPTLAVALAKPFADGPRWRDARDIAAAARARGVPWHLPASPATTRLGMAPDGTHAYAVGDDGVIRVYDLAARTAQVVPAAGAAVAFVDAGRLAVFAPTEIVELAGATRRTIPLAAAASEVEADHGTIWWIDVTGAAFRLAPDAGAPTPIAIPGGAVLQHIWPSPDGTRAIASGRAGAYAIAGTSGSSLLPDALQAVGWDADDAHLIAATFRDGKILEVALADPPAIQDRIGRGWPDRVVLANGALAMQNRGSLWNATARTDYHDAVGIGLAVTRDAIVVAGASDGRIALVDGDHRHELIAPVARLDRVTASPRSPYIVGAGSGGVFVWNADDVMPKRLADAPLGGIAVGAHALLLPGVSGPATWIDLVAGTQTAGPPIGWMTRVATSPSRTSVVAVVEGAAHVIHPGLADDRVLATGVRFARFVDDRRVVVERDGGHLEVHAIDAGATDAAIDRIGDERAIDGLYAAADTVLVSTGRTLVRFGLADRTRTTLALAVAPATLWLGPDGTAWFADGAAWKAWRADGSVATVATVPSAITNMIGGAGHVALDTADGGAIVDLATGARARTLGFGSQPRPAFDGPGVVWSSAASSSDAGVIVVPAAAGDLHVVDGVTGTSWHVGQPGAQTDNVLASVTLDGAVAWELRPGPGHATIVTWPLALPADARATAAWLATLTNAVASDDDRVTW